MDRVRSSLGQVTDCVTSLEIRSADYIEIKWNPFLAGRQRTLSILRKLEARVQGLERSILTRLHRIIRDDKLFRGDIFRQSLEYFIIIR